MATTKKQWVLKAEMELRCEVPATEKKPRLCIKLLPTNPPGTAEVFGIEMVVNKEYYFEDENVAVFTWYGCTLELDCPEECTIYESDKTPMVAYVNTHAQLEARRDVALESGDFGPRVIVVGPCDHGKSTTCQILSAYAVRLDRTPIFVDLDLGQGSYVMPGTISAMPLEKMNMSVEDGFSKSMPLAYFHGHTTPQGNVDLYKKLISTLALKVEARLNKDLDAKASGIIINTCGWIDKGGYDALMHAIQAFHVDVILVMGHEKLYSLLSASLGSQMPIILLPSSGGVVTRDQDARRRHRKARIKEYFYGPPKHVGGGFTFSPHRQEIKLKTVRLLRAGGVQVSEGMRLVGESAEVDNCSLTRITPSADLAGSIVAVLQPEADTGDGAGASGGGTTAGSKETISPQLVTANVAGFLSIVSVDLEQDTMTVLAPCVGALPSKYLLVGNLKWVE